MIFGGWGCVLYSACVSPGMPVSPSTCRVLTSDGQYSGSRWWCTFGRTGSEASAPVSQKEKRSGTKMDVKVRSPHPLWTDLNVRGGHLWYSPFHGRCDSEWSSKCKSKSWMLWRFLSASRNRKTQIHWYLAVQIQIEILIEFEFLRISQYKFKLWT